MNTDPIPEAPEEMGPAKCHSLVKQHPLFLLSYSVQQSEMHQDWKIVEEKKIKDLRQSNFQLNFQNCTLGI